MGRYVSFEEIRIRTLGKVKYTDRESDENKMHVDLANALISEGEVQVELDLSPRYESPFQGIQGEAFSTLAHGTKMLLKTLCELQAVMKILDTDFGRGTVNGAEKYYESLQKRYDRMVKQIMEYRDGYGSGWKYPPLPGLKLMWANAQADSGFVGEVLVISPSGESDSFPARRINDPSKTFIYGETLAGDEWWLP
jgi:hypothetical protein